MYAADSEEKAEWGGFFGVVWVARPCFQAWYFVSLARKMHTTAQRPGPMGLQLGDFKNARKIFTIIFK